VREPRSCDVGEINANNVNNPSGVSSPYQAILTRTQGVPKLALF